MEWLLPIMILGMCSNDKFANCNFFGCINDYQRYDKIYSKYGSDK